MGFKIKGGNVDDLRKTIAEQSERKAASANAPRFAKWIPSKEDGELEVRFLANPENGGWISFQSVYDPSKRGPQVLTEENEEYYEQKRHESGDKAYWPTTSYYAPALEIKTGEVITVEVRHSIVEDILLLGDRWGEKTTGKKGDITGIDIALFKTGTGKDTEYHAEFSGSADIDTTQYTVPKLWDILESKVRYQQEQSGKPEFDSTSMIEDEKFDRPPFVPDNTDSSVQTITRTPRKIKRA